MKRSARTGLNKAAHRLPFPPPGYFLAAFFVCLNILQNALACRAAKSVTVTVVDGYLSLIHI